MEAMENMKSGYSAAKENNGFLPRRGYHPGSDTMDLTPLIWVEPWLTPVILNLRNIVKTAFVPTAAVTPDGKTLYYNPDFWNSLSREEKIAVQIHELLHIVNQHSKRRETRNWKIWNIACDRAINYQIISCGYRLPQGALPGENDSAENIYRRLETAWTEAGRIRADNAGANMGNILGTNLSSDADKTKLENANAEPPDISSGDSRNNRIGHPRYGTILSDDLLKRNEDGSDTCMDPETLEAVDAAVKLAGVGTTPLSRKFTPAASRNDWRVILQAFTKSALGDDYDYLSYEFDEFGVCEDILTPKPHARICALIDESGSIGDELYRVFLGELDKMKHFAKVMVSGFTDDTPLNAVPLKDYRRTMTGGTNVLRAYKEACYQRFDCIIVLTDGFMASFPDREPAPTIWVMPHSFGRKREVLL